MKDRQKIKNNLLVGAVGQIVMLSLGVIVPKLVLSNYGSEINGLLSSITNIYAYISIVEAGISAASCQALYKAIADETQGNINRVLSATNKYFQKTGIVYLLLILVCSIFYPFIIKSKVPYHIVALIVAFNGIGNVINYFFHGKYLILLKADGKNYIRSGIETFTNVIKQLAKIIFIHLGYDVLSVQFAIMFVSFVQMFFIIIYIKKRYSWIDLSVKPDYKAISQSKNVLVHQINYLVVANTDIVLLSMFSSMKVVSIYSMYMLFYSIVDKFLHIIRDSIEFKIANFFYTNQEEFIKFFRMYEIYYITFSFALYSIIDVLILPFLSLYTSDVNDTDYIIANLPLFFTLLKLMGVIRYPYDMMIHVSGHFKQTQNFAIVESVTNVLLSLLLIRNLEIIGVLMGTIIASFCRTAYLMIYVYRSNIINDKIIKSLKCICLNFLIFVILKCFLGEILINSSSYVSLVSYAIPISLCISLVYFLINSLCNLDSFKYACFCIKNLLFKNRLNNEEVKKL